MRGSRRAYRRKVRCAGCALQERHACARHHVVYTFVRLFRSRNSASVMIPATHAWNRC